MAVIDDIKSTIFAAPMPDMPAKLREIWQVAFMLRRKYASPSGLSEDADHLFRDAWRDTLAITEAYGNSETVQALMLEVYLDIERQWKVVRARRCARFTAKRPAPFA